jgi:hypothetical protein
MDIIADFFNIVKKHTDIPNAFIIAGAYGIVARTVGRFFKFEDLKNYRPNLFIILASPPKMTRRGELLNCIKQTTDAAFNTYHELLKSPNALEEQKAHMLDGGSPQGLIDDINNFREKGISSYAITSTEFGKRFEKIISDSSYMKGMDSLLCKLYSGESDYESFSERGAKGGPRFLPPDQYFNLIGTMQKLEKYVTEKSFAETGLARRMSVFSLSGKDLPDKNYKPLLGRNVEVLYNDLEVLGREIGNMMFKYHQQVEEKGECLVITYSDIIRDEINRLDKEYTDKAKKLEDNPYYLYLQGRSDQIIKFAMNRAIAHDSLNIGNEELEHAKRHVNCGTKDIRSVLENLVIPEKLRNKEKQIEKLFTFIVQKKPHNMILRYFTKMYGVHAKDLAELYTILVEDGRIELNNPAAGKFDYKIIV